MRLILSCGWLEFRRLDTSCGWLRPMADLDSGGWIRVTYRWLHPTDDSSSGGWIRLKTDSILRLTRVPAPRSEMQLSLSCGWLKFYTLIYQVNLRTYSAKCIIFMACFLPTDFSYHLSKLWLLLQEPWRSLRKVKEA